MRKTISLALLLALGLAVGIAKADFVFGTPSNLGPTVNSSQSDVPCSMSANRLELYFFSDRPGGFGNSDIWVTTRLTVDDDWGTPLNLGPPVNSSDLDSYAMVSSDGLEIYFASTRPGGLGLGDIWVTTRKSRHEPWDPPVNLGPPVNSAERDYGVFVSHDGLEFYFNSMRAGPHDIYVMRRATTSDDWDTPVNLGPVVNSPSHDIAPNLSADRRYLFFSDHPRYGSPAIPIRSGGFGGADIWLAGRLTASDNWNIPVNLGLTINTATDDFVPNLSPDGSTLYFASTRAGGYGGQNGDIWQAPILPIVDFAGDGMVDGADMCTMLEHWGEDYSLCDIGPTPLGDGVVDVHDLVTLAEHLLEEVKDPTLIAHWPLDEMQGAVAYNDASDCDGTLIGGPVWQPDGGMVAGALQFDGIDDYVSTDFVLNPTDGKFSVVTWLKGGAPGQAILSQTGMSNWLCTDSVEGCLMTELKAYGRGAPGPLLSQAIITEGEWHRIALVWDDSYRRLYIDGAEVATDTAPLSDLEEADGGLYFGVGSALAPGTFFSGLIDEIRIYDRVVSP